MRLAVVILREAAQRLEARVVLQQLRAQVRGRRAQRPEQRRAGHAGDGAAAACRARDCPRDGPRGVLGVPELPRAQAGPSLLHLRGSPAVGLQAGAHPALRSAASLGKSLTVGSGKPEQNAMQARLQRPRTCDSLQSSLILPDAAAASAARCCSALNSCSSQQPATLRQRKQEMKSSSEDRPADGRNAGFYRQSMNICMQCMFSTLQAARLQGCKSASTEHEVVVINQRLCLRVAAACLRLWHGGWRKQQPAQR